MQIDPNFADWIFKGVLSGVAIFIVKILVHLENSIDEINVNLAKMGERHESQREKVRELHDEMKELKNDYFKTRDFIKRVW